MCENRNSTIYFKLHHVSWYRECSPTGSGNGGAVSTTESRWGTSPAPGNMMQLEINGRISIFTHLIQVAMHRRCSPSGIRGGNNSPIAASGWGTFPVPGNMMELEINGIISIFTHLIQVAMHWTRRCSPPRIVGGNNSPIAASA